jgi:hypothetical protein
MEKFVDSYVDMSDPLPLGEYMRHQWESVSNDDSNLPMVHQIDSQQAELTYHMDTVKNSNIFSAITTGNRLYSNLRVLEKSLAYVYEHKQATSPNLWCLWHLEILRQIHTDLLAEVRALAPEIGLIAATAHIRLVTDLLNCGQINSATGRVEKSVKFCIDKGNTAFSVYRSWFWDTAKARVEMLTGDKTSEGHGRQEILKRWLGDHHLITFAVSMSAQPGTETADLWRQATELGPDGRLGDWRSIGQFNHFSWLLANY